MSLQVPLSYEQYRERPVFGGRLPFAAYPGAASCRASRPTPSGYATSRPGLARYLASPGHGPRRASPTTSG